MRTDTTPYAKGLTRAALTGASNISTLAPVSTPTIIISSGINIPAGNSLQGHRAPDVTEGQTGSPAVVRSRAGSEPAALPHSTCPSETISSLGAGSVHSPDTTPSFSQHFFFWTHLTGQALPAHNRTWPKMGAINVCKSILGLSHLAGHWESRPGVGFGAIPLATSTKNTAVAPGSDHTCHLLWVLLG